MAKGGNGDDVEIVVIGDLYWDTAVVPFPAGKSDSDHLQPEPAYARINRPDGAWLLQSMIETAPGLKVKVHGYGEKKAGGEFAPLGGVSGTEEEKCRRARTVLTLFSKDDKEKNNKVYRVDPKQEFVWVALPPGSPQNFSNSKDIREQVYTKLSNKLRKKLNSSAKKRIVVVNETRGLDFCNLKFEYNFLDNLLSTESWLIYHMANPSSQDGKQENKNKLWNLIKDRTTPNGLLSRTMVVVSTTTLRSAGFYIDQQAAQETIAEDLMRWLKSSKDFPLNDLDKLPAHLIVRCDYDSAIHFCSLNEQDSRRKLHIYSRPFEGSPQSNEDLYGKMPGYGRILVASIVQRLAQPFPPTPNQLRNGICDGLRRTAAHFRNGFASKKFGENYSKPNTPPPSPFENLFRRDLKLLFKDYPRDDYKNIGTYIKVAPELPLLAKISIPWAELKKVEPEENKLRSFSRVESLMECLDSPQSFEKFLFDVVKNGLNETLKNDKYKEKDLEDKYLISLPALKLKNLISIDRDEIDGITDLYVLIRKYLQDDLWLKPLSFAVFGPPGTGKSFSVNQILEAASEASPKSGKVEILEYNLSQFSKPDNLARAFHKGQHVGLSGKIPLIFFDEFDAALPGQLYGWLKYFLAPMEDGKFKGAETDDIYTIGRAILVFAGGTAHKFDDFAKKVKNEIEAKGPDFISRLKAHLDILPINEPDKNGKPQKFIVPPCRLLLRRAILLRAALESDAKGCLDDKKTARIDEQVIEAFLYIPEYKHGNRSLKAVVQMATLENDSFRVASLASKEQLEMHVDGEQFLKSARGERKSSV